MVGWIRSRLLDDESRLLFSARMCYLFRKDYDAFMAEVRPVMEKYRLVNYEMLDMIRAFGTEDAVLYGREPELSRNRAALELAGMRIAAVSVHGGGAPAGDWDGIPVVPEQTLGEDRWSGALFVTAARGMGETLRDRLISFGVPAERIHVPEQPTAVVSVNRPMQYFDVFSPRGDEVFADVGAYDGQTALDFSKWTGGNYKKILCVEPIPSLQEILLRRTASLHDVQVLPYAAWNRREELSFSDNGSASRNSSGGTPVQAAPLDEITEEPVTFLKMDIEGSELAALRGARKLIRKHRPRLAVCIYHRRRDILTIPLYLIWLVPGYRFVIRHYSGSMLETVLFAVPKEEAHV